MAKYEKLKAHLTLEQEILEFWEENKIFEKSLDKTKGQGCNYVFYEGPPTANGKPHFGHLMPRVYKDLFPRYKTMRGFYVLRKGGWDTHGLPVELEVEKALGLNSKKDIERYGVENFINKCKESVWEYKADWEQMLRRMGFWIDIENAYITMTDEYIESVWWALKEIWKQGLLYRGYKVLPYCPRCGTPLSSHEVAQGYDEITEPAITVKFELKNRENEYVLAWTTTPWTLPGNVALAVGAEIDYVKVKQGNEIYYLAAARENQVLAAGPQPQYEVLETLKGSEMDGWEYEPLLPFLHNILRAEERTPRAWTVIATEGMVSTEEGTGVVHTAVMYGEEDYELGERMGLPKYHTVDLNGRFTQDVKPWAGRFVKDCDKEITQYLKEQGKLYKVESYTHTYPFCWRCDTPLLYYAVDSWFIRTTAKQKEIIANNKKINWHPEHMRDGRFGDFLEKMKDWALSRDRYWGTPLPIWICNNCQKQICVGSRRELIELAYDKKLAQSVELHKPHIDEVFLKCPDCNGQMRRVPQVIDCWFDSGMMHTAQWHHPFENHEKFKEQFPADFICEGLDQTRGWFYSLLVTSTLLYPDHEYPYPHPYKHVIVTGQGLDEKGKRMSKSRGNVLDPMEIVDEYGADVLRWYLYSGGAPWRDRLLSKEAAREGSRILETIRNVYNFFALYASIDGFDPKKHTSAVKERALLDRWVLSRLQGLIYGATDALEQYDVVEATKSLEGFVDDLSNWYVRSSRPRFWSEEDLEGVSKRSADKRAAYSTLYEALVELSKLLAPFVPFLAEAMYRALKQPDMPESVHLCDWPAFNADLYDAALEKEMARARSIVTAGLQARNKAKIKVRQPLRRAVFHLRDCTAQEWQRLCHSELGRLIQAELNVKTLEAEDLVAHLSKYGTYGLQIKKDKLGPRYGKLLPKIEHAVQALDARLRLAVEGELRLAVDGQEIVLGQDEFEKKFFANEGFADGHDGPATVILETALNEELRQEGYIREFVHQLQELRKKAGYEVTDRIALFYEAEEELRRAIERYTEHIKAEALALELHQGGVPAQIDYAQELSVNGLRARVGLLRRE